MEPQKFEFSEEADAQLPADETQQFSQAVLHSADWTVETIVSQLNKKNIEMNPRFQRRDAWPTRKKSAFIESLILGLPVPQIVLAEKQGQRGKYIVLDGKQRLLSLLQFTGQAEGPHNAFRLGGLEARPDLGRKSYQNLQDPAYDSELNALLNYTIRTVVIRNWPSYDFLHLVFLRLNTGSVKLSPQELRQAMFPGDFSNFVDDHAAASEPIRSLLNRDTPDPRMRDVELLVRFLAFHFYLPEYGGRMKSFLDEACGKLNAEWEIMNERVIEAVTNFDLAISALNEVLGKDQVARKANSRSFNRAIFDALVFFAANKKIRNAMLANAAEVKAAYSNLLENNDFLDASESDTAGVPNTLARLRIWGQSLRDALVVPFALPEARPADPINPEARAGIKFTGFEI